MKGSDFGSRFPSSGFPSSSDEEVEETGVSIAPIYVVLDHVECKVVGTTERPDGQSNVGRSRPLWALQYQQRPRGSSNDEEQTCFEPHETGCRKVFHLLALEN